MAKAPVLLLAAALVFGLLLQIRVGVAQDSGAAAQNVGAGDGAPSATGEAGYPTDYIANVAISVDVDVDGATHQLRCEAGQRLHDAASTFASAVGLSPTFVPRLVQGLVDTANAPPAAQQQQQQRQAGSARTPRAIAEVPVVVNDEQRRAIMYEGEDPVSAARRFTNEASLDADPEIDSILRTLVNRLRAALGARDGLPLTIDAAPTLTTVDVNAGDGTGRILLLRVLQGETAGEAAAGFLERLGYEVETNYEPLRRMAQAKLDAQVSSTGPASEPEASPPLIDPREGFVLPVSFDAASGASTNLPLVFRYGQDPAAVARDFITAAGLGQHAQLESFVASVEGAIRTQLSTRDASAASSAPLGPSQGPQAGRDLEAAVEDLEEAMGVKITVSPYAATIPLQVGGVGYEVEVPSGTPLRTVAKVFCARQWSQVRRAFQAVLDGLMAPGSRAATATPDMCGAVTADMMGKWYLSEQVKAQQQQEARVAAFSTP